MNLKLGVETGERLNELNHPYFSLIFFYTLQRILCL